MRKSADNQAHLSSAIMEAKYPYMCRIGHAKIGHSTDEESCPVCIEKGKTHLAEDRALKAEAKNVHVSDLLGECDCYSCTVKLLDRSEEQYVLATTEAAALRRAEGMMRDELMRLHEIICEEDAQSIEILIKETDALMNAPGPSSAEAAEARARKAEERAQVSKLCEEEMRRKWLAHEESEPLKWAEERQELESKAFLAAAEAAEATMLLQEYCDECPARACGQMKENCPKCGVGNFFKSPGPSAAILAVVDAARAVADDYIIPSSLILALRKALRAIDGENHV